MARLSRPPALVPPSLRCSTALVALTVALTCVAWVTEASAQDWQESRNSLGRVGWTDVAGDITAPAQANRLYLGGTLAGSQNIVLEDLDGDGRSEIFIGSGGRAEARSATGQTIWDSPPLGINQLVGVTDLDNDGNKELVATGSSIVILDLNTGEVLWTRNQSGASGYTSNGTIPADTDRDGVQELVVGPGSLGVVQVFDFDSGFQLVSNNNLAWEAGGLSCCKAITIADVDNNGAPDVIVGSLTGTVAHRIFNGADGTLLDSVRGYSYAGPQYTLNLDDDPQLETVAFGRRADFADVFVRVWDYAFDEFQTESANAQIGHMAEFWLDSPPAIQSTVTNTVTDLEGDGDFELITSFWTGANWVTYIFEYVETGDGDTDPPTRQGSLNILEMFVDRHVEGIVDLDGDGNKEVLLSTTAAATIARPPFSTVRAMGYNNGTVTERWTQANAQVVRLRRDAPLEYDDNGSTGAVFQDVDLDGRPELFMLIDGNNDTRPDQLVAYNGDSETNERVFAIGGAGAQFLRVLETGDGLSAPGSVRDTLILDGLGQVRILDRNFQLVGPPIQLGGYSHNVTAADMDNDGTLEVLAVTSTGQILCIAGESLLEDGPVVIEWSYYGGNISQTTDHFVDLPNGDLGLVVRSQPSVAALRLVVLSPTGQQLAQSAPLPAYPANLMTGEFSPDPGREIIFTYPGAVAPRYTMYRFDGDANTLIQVWDVDDQYTNALGEEVQYGPARWAGAADFNGDGYLDLYYDQESGPLHVHSGVDGTFFGQVGPAGDRVGVAGDFRPDIPGTEVWYYSAAPRLESTTYDEVNNIPYPLTYTTEFGVANIDSTIFWGATHVDINADGNIDAVSPSRFRNQLSAINAVDGTLIWSTYFVDGELVTDELTGRRNDIISSQATGADVDGDGMPEAVFTASDGYLYAVNAEDGTLSWSTSLRAGTGTLQEPIVVDLDGDGVAEIIVSTQDGQLKTIVGESFEAPAEVREIASLDTADADIDQWEIPREIFTGWDAVAGATGYRVALISANDNLVVPWEDVGDRTTWSFPGLRLTVGATYFVAVEATNADGDRSASTLSDGVEIIDLTPPTLMDVVATPTGLNPALGGAIVVTGLATDITGLTEARYEIIDDFDRARRNESEALAGVTVHNLNLSWDGNDDDGAPMSDGDYTFRVTITDIGGFEVSAEVTVRLDRVAPGTPTVASPGEGDLINQATPVISGQAEANATVNVYIDNTLVCTTLALGSGAFNCTSTIAIADGDHTVSAEAIDSASNTGELSDPLNFSVDTQASDPPVFTAPANNSVLADRRPTFEGTAPDDAVTVTVTYTDTEACTATVEVGVWSCTPPADLPEGVLQFVAVAFDGANNPSSASQRLTLTLDVTAPGAPNITAPMDGGRTGMATPNFRGTSEPGAAIVVTVDGDAGLTCATTADGDGDWVCPLATPLADGAHTVSATAQDVAGNTGAASSDVSFTVDLTGPPAPAITDPTEGTYVGLARPVFEGTGQPDAEVQVRVDDVAVCTGALVNPGGGWSCESTQRLAEGDHVAVAVAFDDLGNPSSDSAAVNFIVDTVAPPQPVINVPSTDEVVSTPAPTFEGTAEPLASVRVRLEAQVDPICVGNADDQGRWSCTSLNDIPDGEIRVLGTAYDRAGLSSNDSLPVRFYIDTDDDIDDDGLPNGFEEDNNLDPFDPEDANFDPDTDGLSNLQEFTGHTLPRDADTDDDGVRDGDEPTWDEDTDGDGLINALDPDSDNDGLFDGTELGVTAPGQGTDRDRGFFRADADPTSVTDPLEADTDDGSTDDGFEDWNLNGRVDDNELDPLDDTDDLFEPSPDTIDILADTDDDGLTDLFEGSIGTDPEDGDTDDDGVGDSDEPNPSADMDGDFLVSARDPDSDNDGLPDGLEAGVMNTGADTDLARGRFLGDAEPATRTSIVNPDTDGDGQRDGLEDTDRNGRVDADEGDPRDPDLQADVTDTDGDGLSDIEEVAFGTIFDDGDTDDDGILDGAEPNFWDDNDFDGTPNPLDDDSDDDGVKDGTESGVTAPTPDTADGPSFVADANPATITAMLIADTDRDGFLDGEEDINANGRVDADESDPRDPRDPDLIRCDFDFQCTEQLGAGFVCDPDTRVCVEEVVDPNNDNNTPDNNGNNGDANNNPDNNNPDNNGLFNNGNNENNDPDVPGTVGGNAAVDDGCGCTTPVREAPMPRGLIVIVMLVGALVLRRRK